MPNWVSTEMTVSCDDAEKLKSFIDEVKLIDDDEELNPFSFNKIIPMPDVLNGTVAGTSGDIGFDAWHGDPSSVLRYKWVRGEGVTNAEELRAFLLEKYPKYKTDGDKQKLAFDQTGHRTWYSWQSNNWGTKWDACHAKIISQKDTEIIYRFDTAWAFPEPVIEALVEKYPHLSISGLFSEESRAFEGSFEYQPGSDYEIAYTQCGDVEEVRDEDDEDEGYTSSVNQKTDTPEPVINVLPKNQNTWF